MSDLSNGFRGFNSLGAEARRGMQVRFVPSPVGTNSDRVDAMQLAADKTYVVREVEIGNFITRITLVGVEGWWFNSLFFTPV